MAEKPIREELELRIQQLKPGDHLCCIYESQEEWQGLIKPFIGLGLERREKIIYIVDSTTAEKVLRSLLENRLESKLYSESGQLIFLNADQAYMQEGIFDPERMISFLQEQTERAINEGYSALRITGEMSWAVRGLPGSERLIEYESKLNDFLSRSKCLAICQYDRRRFEPRVILDLLTTHPIIIIGTEFFDNFYYIPSKDFLAPDPSAARLNTWLKSLADQKRTEEALEEAERKYRFLFERAPVGIPKDDRPDESCGYSILTKHPRVFIAANTDKCRLYLRLNSYLDDREFAVFLKAVETYCELFRAYNCLRLDIIHDLRLARIFKENQLSDLAEFISKTAIEYNIQNIVSVCDVTNAVYIQIQTAINCYESKEVRIHLEPTFRGAEGFLDELRGSR